MTDYTKATGFIHDLSNYIAIADGSIKRIQKLRTKEQTEDNLNEIDKSLVISEEYMKNCIGTLKEFRTFLHMIKDNK